MNKKKLFLVITNGLIVFLTGILIKQQINKYKFVKYFTERNVCNYVKQSNPFNPNIVKLKKYWFSGLSIPTKSFLVDIYGQKLLLIEEREKEYSNGRISQYIKQNYVNSYKLLNKSNTKDLDCIIDNNFEFSYSPLLLSLILIKKQKPKKNDTLWNTILNILDEIGNLKVSTYQGIKFGQEQIVVGDFIYNPHTNILRCYKPKFIGTKDCLDWYIFEEKLLIALRVLALSITLFYFIKLLIDALKQKSTQRLNIINNLQAYKWINQKSYKCYLCQTNNHDIIFLPCFHLIVCSECSSRIQFCPACKTEIKNKVKIFLG